MPKSCACGTMQMFCMREVMVVLQPGAGQEVAVEAHSAQQT